MLVLGFPTKPIYHVRREKQMAKKYLLGLDLGTNSVGWCVTDENNKIVKKNGKSLWGARLFDEASDAKERRMHRSSRRRLARRRQRIDLLRAIMKPEMDKVDPTFYFRLDESMFLPEDKHELIASNKYLLFNDPSFTDREFYSKDKYPTIYHLRQHLLSSHQKEDIRFIYLCLAHMVKYRGNFLNEGQTFKPFDPTIGKNLFNELAEELSEFDNTLLDLKGDCIDTLKKSLQNSNGVSAMTEALVKEFGKENKYLKDVVFPLISGGKRKIDKIYPDEDKDSLEDVDPKEICFKDAGFEESYAKLSEQFPSNVETRIIGTSKKLYDFFLLGKMLGDSTTISETMVAIYDKHAKDLKSLKHYLKQRDKAEGANLYAQMFGPKTIIIKNETGKDKVETLNNYTSYVGIYKANGKAEKFGHIGRKDFYAFVKKLLLDSYEKQKTAMPGCQDDYLDWLSKEIEKGSFLPRQNSSDNGIYPYQLNLQEMKQIIENQAPFYPFFEEMDEDGYSNKDKIISLLTFKIPYYVGPLVRTNGETDDPIKKQLSSYSWAKFKNGCGEIRPWNFDKCIDKAESAEAFIQRMLNKCTYLPGEYCLPKQSILFQEYEVLSFLNKVCVNGVLINNEQKKKIIEQVFKQKAKVTVKDLTVIFKPESVKLTYCSGGTEITSIPCSMSSYVFFSKATVFGKEFVDSEKGREITENVIRDMTIFEEWSILRERLTKKYGITSEQVLNSLKTKKMVGWGRLSRKLLEMKTVVSNSYGEVTEKTLIQLMRETNVGLMELINDETLSFKKQIEEAADKEYEVFDDPKKKHEAVVKSVDESYVSPGMKRPLIQAMNIIEDVEHILGRPIDEYYIECTRSNKAKKGKTTNSRKDELAGIYKTAMKATKEDTRKKLLSDCADKLSALDDAKLRSEKYFLYFLQLGKDMYSLEPIDLDRLEDYDIDHIVPRALVKDDSVLGNKVLVKSSLNREKSAAYPIPSTVFKRGREDAERFYDFLKKSKLLSDKKYAALTRTTPLTDKDLNSFVNRQLVYTNQAVIALVDTIKKFQRNQSGNEPKIVYSKAENVSDFRQKFDLLKCRDINDFHHAHDAYLNICVGRAIDTYYHKSIYPNIRKGVKAICDDIRNQKGTLNLEKVFESSDSKEENKQRANLLDSDSTVVWDYEHSIAEIRKNIETRYDILLTKMQTSSGRIFSKTKLDPKGKVPSKYVLKENINGEIIKRDSPLRSTNKYGGIYALSYPFFALVEESNKKRGTNTSICSIPGYFCNANDERSLSEYLKSKKPRLTRIIMPRLLPNFVIRSGSSKAIVSGSDKGGFLITPESALFYKKDEISTLRKIRKLMDFISKHKRQKKAEEDENVPIEECINEYMSYKNNDIILSPAGSQSSNEIVLTEEELKKLYNKYSSLNGSFLKLFSGYKNVIAFLEREGSQERFMQLSTYQKAVFLSSLAIYFNASSQRVNLDPIGGPKNSGGNTIGATILGDWQIILESPTGFYSKVLWPNN